MNRKPSRAGLLAALALAATIGGPALVIAWKATLDPGTAWLAADGPARWISYPTPPDMRARGLVEMTTVFRRSFVVVSVPSSASLSLRAFRDGDVLLNGRPLPMVGDGKDWKRARSAEAAHLLRTGDNELSVRVRNGAGPPALWLRLAGPGLEVTTDAGWEASLAGAAWRPVSDLASPPADGRFDPGGILPSPLLGLQERWPLLLAFFLGVAGLWIWLGKAARRFTPGSAAPADVTAGIAVLFWVGLFAHNAPLLPIQIGFDAGQHLEYVQYVLDRHAIPLADEGWQMFQPPLYYLLCAFGLGVTGAGTSDPGAALVIRAIGFTAAASIIVLTARLLGRRFPGRPLPQVGGVLFAAFLPPVLLLSHFPTNELLAAALGTATLVVLARQLEARRWSTGRAILIGSLLGLALLAKFSALLLVPVVFGTLAWGALASPNGEVRGRWTAILTSGAFALGVSGWHFARVWARFGDPFVGGWEARPGLGWWLDPGFRTASHFLRFGRALQAPAFAGLDGFWDGLYSTMWGDGMLSGLAGTSPLPPWWSPPLQAAGFLLALFPMSFLAVGLLRTVRSFLRDPTPLQALLLFTPVLFLGALAVMSVRVPSVAQDKAFYGLMAVAPLAAILGAGLEGLAGRPWATPILAGAMGCWALASFSTVWVDRSSANVGMMLAVSRLGVGDTRSGEQGLRETLQADPGNWNVRSALARVLAERDGTDAEIEELLRPGEFQPDLASRLVAIAVWADVRGRTELAQAAALRCIDRDPDSSLAWTVLASTRERSGDLPGSIDAWREVLRMWPQDAQAHLALSRLYATAGNEPASRFHRSIAAKVRR